jgi:hypothetical protein
MLRATCVVQNPTQLRASAVRVGIISSWLPIDINPARPVVHGVIGHPFDIDVESATHEPILQLWFTWSTPALLGEQWGGKTCINVHELAVNLASRAVGDRTGAATENNYDHILRQTVDVTLPVDSSNDRPVLSMDIEIRCTHALLQWAHDTSPAVPPIRPSNLATAAQLLAISRRVEVRDNARHNIVSEALIDGVKLPLRYLLMTRPAEPLPWNLVYHWLQLVGLMQPDLHVNYTSEALGTLTTDSPWQMAALWYQNATGILACAHAGRLLAELVRVMFLCSIYRGDKTLSWGARLTETTDECEAMNAPLPCVGGQTPETCGVLAGDCEDAAVMNHLNFLALRWAFLKSLRDVMEPMGGMINFDPNAFGRVHQQLADSIQKSLPASATSIDAFLLASLGFLAMQYSDWMAIVTTDAGRNSAGLHATTMLLPLSTASLHMGKMAFDAEWVPLDTALFDVDDRRMPQLKPEQQPLRYVLTTGAPLRGLLVEATNSMCPLVAMTTIAEQGLPYSAVFVNGAHNNELRERIISNLMASTNDKFDETTKLVSIPCCLTDEFYKNVLQLVGPRAEFILGSTNFYDLLNPPLLQKTIQSPDVFLRPSETPTAALHLVSDLRRRTDELEFAAYHARSRIPPPRPAMPLIPIPMAPTSSPDTIVINLAQCTVDLPNDNGVPLTTMLPMIKQKFTVTTVAHTAYANQDYPTQTACQTGTLLYLELRK